MATYREIKDRILNFCGQGAGGDTEDLVSFIVNQRYKGILDSGLVPHEHREFTFASVASTSQYGMPLYVRKILNIEDPTNDLFIHEITARGFDKGYPGTDETGTPNKSYSLGTRGVEKFPAADGVISIESSSTADTGSNYKIRVTGFNTSGVLVTELITATGTTAVNSSNSYDSTLGVERVVKASATGFTFAGNITIKDASSNTIGIIPTFWTSSDYEWIEFQPIPSSAVTYNIRAEMRKPPLVNDEDWPEFDQEFHDLLVWFTTQDLLPHFGKGDVADRHRLTAKERWDEFKREKAPTQRALWVFSNVQSRAGFSQRPLRPYIEGVDFGVAAGQ